MSSRRNTPTLLDRGTLIEGRYRIDDCLAWGGMGIVYAATHVDLGHRYALKFLRPDLASDAEACARFLDEARMASGFRSEYVARVLDYGHYRDLPYMVAEYLEGIDLWTMMDERGPLPIQEATSYIAEACAALAEVHAAGIVHRDLKPENLFLAQAPDGKVRVKLLDFGVSKRIDSGRQLTKPRKGVGSPLYMSPEQMRAQPIDGRADVWALGAVLYELLTGKLPFDAESVPEICNRVLRGAPRPPRQLRHDLPPELEAVILRCLEKEKSRRFLDVAELAVALASFGSAEAARAAEEAACILGKPGCRARTTGVPEPTPPRGRRRLAAAAAAAALLGALAISAPRAHSPDPEPLPPSRALSSWVDVPLLRVASARAEPEPERKVRFRPTPQSPQAASEGQVVLETDPDPEPEPAEPPVQRPPPAQASPSTEPTTPVPSPSPDTPAAVHVDPATAPPRAAWQI